jgi:MarR family transcriptional regulator for hemolysin
MTYLIDDLVAAGLIERRSDPADRRARRVVATVRGAELLDALDRRLAAAEADLLRPLDDEAREVFRSQLRLVATRIDALDPLGNPCELAQTVEDELPTPPASARLNRHPR